MDLFRLQPTGRLKSGHLIDYGYTIGTNPSSEQVITISAPDSRQVNIPGVSSTRYYNVAVQAYRIVDSDVSSSGIIKSNLVKVTAAPYRPGDLTIAGIGASNIVDATARSLAGFSSDGKITQIINGINLPSTGMAVGLNLTSDYIGYWDGSAWKAYLHKDGDFKLGNGTTGPGLAWDQLAGTLAIRGSIVADDISSGTMSGARIQASTLTADKIATGVIAANQSISVGTIIIGTGAVAGNDYIRCGQTAFNTGTGFWLGQVSSKTKLSLGNSATNYLTWDETTGTLSLKGSINITSGSITWAGLDSTTTSQVLNSNVKVGGRNLISNSGYFRDITNWTIPATAFTYSITGNKELVITKALNVSGIHAGVLLSTPPVLGSVYTVSWYAKSSVAGAVQFSIEKADGTFQSSVNATFAAPDTYQLCTASFTAAANDVGGTKFSVTSSTFALNQSITILWMKLEQGNVATDWAPAPEDASARLTNIDSTGIYTGTVVANQIDTGTLAASRQITVGGVVIDSGSGSTNGNIRLGQTAYNTGTGFWIGQVAGVSKFSIGNATKYITWDGTSLNIRGSLNADDIGTGYMSASKIDTGSLAASKQITVGGITIDSGDGNTTGNIRLGKANADDTAEGFWLGKNGTTSKFHIGNASNYLKWDGSLGTLDIRGRLNASDITTGTIHGIDIQASSYFTEGVVGVLVVASGDAPTTLILDDASDFPTSGDGTTWTDTPQGDSPFTFWWTGKTGNTLTGVQGIAYSRPVGTYIIPYLKIDGSNNVLTILGKKSSELRRYDNGLKQCLSTNQSKIYSELWVYKFANFSGVKDADKLVLISNLSNASNSIGLRATAYTTGISAAGTGSASRGVEGAGLGYDFYANGSGSNYGPFTGSHDGLIQKDSVAIVGDILCDKQVVYKSNISNCILEVAVTDSPYQKSALGVLSTRSSYNDGLVPSGLKVRDMSYGIPDYVAISEEYDVVSINALGEGQINVCKEGGNIEVGDYICTSSSAGKGMKQDDDIIHNYTVAKARESITWDSNDNSIKQIACIYLAG